MRMLKKSPRNVSFQIMLKVTMNKEILRGYLWETHHPTNMTTQPFNYSSPRQFSCLVLIALHSCVHSVSTFPQHIALFPTSLLVEEDISTYAEEGLLRWACLRRAKFVTERK